jgi:hypothetical protein
MSKHKKSNEAKFFDNFVLPMGLIIVSVGPIYVFVNKDLAWAVSILGPIAICAWNVFYITFVDSKERWPKDSAWTRFYKYITFTR